jgi:superfamily II DNA helicase RecQ
MVRAGLIDMVDASFEKNGKQIEFKRVSLTPDGRALDASTPLSFELTEEIAALPKSRKKKAPKRSAAGSAKARAADGSVAEALKAWRREEAKRSGVPAFRILSDRSLKEIAEQMPATAAALLAVHGIGNRTAEKHGAAILGIVRQARL